MSKGNKSSSSSGGIGFLGLLTIVFITLKLLGKITWSWWWVLAPSWVPCGIYFFICGLLLIMWVVDRLRASI